MRRFQVLTTAIAESDLAQIWLAAEPALRSGITCAAHEIDQALREPLLADELSPIPGHFVIERAPLRAYYRRDVGELRVTIYLIQGCDPGS